MGWPKYRKEVAENCKEYWNYKEELVLEDGLIFKSERMVIPKDLRAQYLCDLHRSHMGEEKTKLFARTSVFWPNMNSDIELCVKSCLPCQASRPSQPTESLYCHSIPHRPWQKVGMDLFDFQGSQYLLVVCYYSNFPFVRLMKSTTSSAVIAYLRTLFAEHGTPDVVFCDQGPQFHSAEFRQFSTTFGFGIEHSSPRYPQANGFIESMVKVIKDLFDRASASGEDPMLSVQAYRATPINARLSSPAELLFGRKIQAVLPIRTSLTETQQAHREVRIDAKRDQQLRYDQHARAYQELQEHQRVLVQLDPSAKAWRPATVVIPAGGDPKAGPRTITVATDDGAQYQRNRKFIRETLVAGPSQEPGAPIDHPGVTHSKVVPQVDQAKSVVLPVPLLDVPTTTPTATTAGCGHSPRRPPQQVVSCSPKVSRPRSTRSTRGIPPKRYEPD